MGKSDTLSNLYIRRRIHCSITKPAWGLEVIYPRDIEGRSRDIGLDGCMVRFRPFHNPYNPHFAANCIHAYNRFMGEGKYLLDECKGKWNGS
jgi:hypothetical protein